MITVRLTRDEFAAIADHNALLMAEGMANRIDHMESATYIISTWNVIDWIRVLVKEGKINPDKITLYVHGEIIKIGTAGELEQWPEGIPPYDKAFDRLFGEEKS